MAFIENIGNIIKGFLFGENAVCYDKQERIGNACFNLCNGTYDNIMNNECPSCCYFYFNAFPKNDEG